MGLNYSCADPRCDPCLKEAVEDVEVCQGKFEVEAATFSEGRTTVADLDADLDDSNDSDFCDSPQPEMRSYETWYRLNGEEALRSTDAGQRDRLLEEVVADMQMSLRENSSAHAPELEEALEVLQKVEHLVDIEHDILAAEDLLGNLRKSLGDDVRWAAVQAMPSFDRCIRKLNAFYEVGHTCCDMSGHWIEIFNGQAGAQTIHALIDKSNSSLVRYRVCAQIPTSLINVMAVANEVQLMSSWNSLLVGEPEVMGRRTAHYMVLNYQMSGLAGMLKVDVLNEIRRFTDVEGGYLCEHVRSLRTDHPSYRQPGKGFKRLQTDLKNMFVACGPDKCVLIQVGSLKLPIAASQWLVKSLGQLAGKSILASLVNNSLRAAEPGCPWQKLVQEDKFGFYHRLGECMASAGSVERQPQTSGAEFGADLASFFERRPFYDPRWRHRSKSNF